MPTVSACNHLFPFVKDLFHKAIVEDKDLSKITVILPTQRLCSIFISLLTKEINSPQLSPNVYSIKDFIANLSDLIAFFKVEVIEACPTTVSKVVGLYFLAETIKSLIN